MSALDLYSVDWLFEQVRDFIAVYRPVAVVVFGTEQDWQFQAAEEERVVVGAAKDHTIVPAGPPEAPGETTIAGQRLTPFATLRQGVVIAIRAICEATTADEERVKESQRRAFAVLRWVLYAIDRVSHGSNTLRLSGKVTLESPETADYQHGALLRVQLAIDVPIFGAPRGTVQLVESDAQTGEARTRARLEACNPDGTSCQIVMETE